MDDFLSLYGDNQNSTQTSADDFLSLYGDNSSGDTTPPILKNAEQIGQKNDPSYRGYCQKFVDDALGLPYPRTGKESAISAWDTAPNKVESLNGVKKGDLIYFQDPTGKEPDGHVGIYEGGNQFYSARDDGIKSDTITNWDKTTGQVPLGYIPQ